MQKESTHLKIRSMLSGMILHAFKGDCSIWKNPAVDRKCEKLGDGTGSQCEEIYEQIILLPLEVQL